LSFPRAPDAAALAIVLNAEVASVAFEEQRQEGQLLIERGEQYQRAIELFLRKNGPIRRNRHPVGPLSRISELRRLFSGQRFSIPTISNSPAGQVPIVPGPSPPALPLIGGNIAGVARTFEHRTVTAYHRRRSYREWEFISISPGGEREVRGQQEQR
jgi:hypothetical protein